MERRIELDARADGALLMRSRVPLGPVERHLPGVLRRHAANQGDKVWLAQRPTTGAGWRTLSYAQAQQQVDAVTQWLLNLDRPGRAVMVLSGNSLEHAVLELAAMQAGMPYVPVTPAYALLSTDFGKLRAMADLIDPAVLFVQQADRFGRALKALDRTGARVVAVEQAQTLAGALAWDDLLRVVPGADVHSAVERITPDGVAKYLFTSGSTGVPKAVPITQHMLCVTMAMHAQTITRGPDTPSSVLLEWLPWSHVAGGTAVFNSVLEDGGTMYLDDGRPTPGEFDKTLRNLREISPTRFSSVPAGYSMLADALDEDPALGQRFFRDLQRLTSSGARLPDSVYLRLQGHAVRQRGHYMPFVAGYGSTETCAATTVVHWPTERAGLVGLPQPGVELKLVPMEDARYEVRVKGPSVMSGYLSQPELTAQAFDEEGFYRMGDAVSFVDRERADEGLAFAGRVAEEFKLQSGIFVRVGSLRVEAINAAAPWLNDVVVTGADRPYVGLLAWLNPAAVQERFGPATALPWSEHAGVRAALRQAFQAHNAQHSGGSMRIRRVLLLDEAPSMDAGEITDKGYINQRAVLARRAEAVDALYAQTPDPRVIAID